MIVAVREASVEPGLESEGAGLHIPGTVFLLSDWRFSVVTCDIERSKAFVAGLLMLVNGVWQEIDIGLCSCRNEVREGASASNSRRMLSAS